MGMRTRGFTLIELMIAITLMVILVGVYVFVANPAGQLGQSRNTERQFQLQAIMFAVRQNVADQATGQFSCLSGPLPTSSKRMTSATGTGNYDVAPCLAPAFLPLPFDPSATSGRYLSASDYDTGYTISINASGTITLAAPYAELGKTVSVSR